jgi:hypothetical protein
MQLELQLCLRELVLDPGGLVVKIFVQVRES